jgi:hypothetical protein
VKEWRQQTLRELAEAAGYSMQDVATLARLDRSTVWRRWEDPHWFERFKGESLRRLVLFIPGIDEYAIRWSRQSHFEELSNHLRSLGLAVGEESIKRAVANEGIPSGYIVNALETVRLMLEGDVQNGIHHLKTFWGREQNRALAIAFKSNGGLFENNESLLSAARNTLIKVTEGRGSIFTRVVAQQVLAHHIAKASGELPSVTEDPRFTRDAFSLRGAFIGLLRHNDDLDAVNRYARLVDKSPTARLVELWAFPTWTRDCNPTRDFELPASLLLRNTSKEVISEIAEYNEAYVFYLVTTYIPLALARDPIFGLRLDELLRALRRRLDSSDSPEFRRACDTLCKQIESTLSNG